MFGFFKVLTGSGSASRDQEPCNLLIGSHPEHLYPVDDPQGLGGYQLAIEALIRDESPEVIYLRSDTGNLSVVRKALEYLSRIGGQVGVADQLPDEELAAIFGVDIRSYQSAVVNPQGDAAAYAG